MLSNAVLKNDFFERLNTGFRNVYNIEGAFSIIAIEVLPSQKNFNKEHYKGILKVVSEHIDNNLSKDSDYFTFLDNSFLIYTAIDSSEKIVEFIRAVAILLEREYPSDVFLKAGFGQYPYDSIEVAELLDYVKENTKVVKKVNLSKSYQNNVATLGSLQFSSMEIMNEIHSYMKQLIKYDQYLFEHSFLVAQGCIVFSKELGLDLKVIRNVAIAALLHDIGYLGVPYNLINKQEPLSKEEWGLVKMHPLVATRNILKGQVVFRDVLSIIEQHHEFRDGSGYPFGLKGEQICIEAQVLSILDTYQAVITPRKHRRALSTEEIIDVFIKNAGIKWSEDLITIFTAILGDLQDCNSLHDKNFSDVSELFDLI